eukprot:416912-Rhodomonas_salina.2
MCGTAIGHGATLPCCQPPPPLFWHAMHASDIGCSATLPCCQRYGVLGTDIVNTATSSSISHWIHDSQLSNLLPSAQAIPRTDVLVGAAGRCLVLTQRMVLPEEITHFYAQEDAAVRISATRYWPRSYGTDLRYAGAVPDTAEGYATSGY